MILLFSTAAFVSAALVFMVQPMVAKALLPTFGGTPQVWTASMLFFQAALLAGYGYAHLTTTRLPVRRQTVTHVLIMLLPLLLLPIALRGMSLVDGLGPALAVLAILAMSVGAPYVVVASTSPLIQRWFSVSDHAKALDPYFLYAAGNAGSLLGLLSYPFLIEPNLSLADQGLFWSVGYLAFIVACGACALAVARSRRDMRSPLPIEPTPTSHAFADVTRTAANEPPTLGRRLQWVGRAFIPSSLLLGVTTHVQTDIAAVPLLWVIPLALYLVTFIIAFSPRRPFGPRAAARVLPFAIVLTVLTFFGALPTPTWANIAIHDATFFIAAMVAHGQLADDRPPARYLTSFYLLLSVGGVLGGIFNALVAPLVFDQVLEYPLLLAAVLLLLPSAPILNPKAERIARLTDLVAPAMYVAVLVAGLAFLPLGADGGPGAWASLVAVSSLVVLRRARRFALTILLLLGVTFLPDTGALYADRTFFGVNRVLDDGEGRHILVSGATIHGAERRTSSDRPVPLTYYHPTGPAGQVFQQLGETSSGRVRDVGLIGLGAGSLAAYSEAGQRFTFFEIDPAVLGIAKDPRLFTFVSTALGAVDLVEGDGRLRIAEAPDGSFDVIVLDAFSSDAIPAHLVTREAFELYAGKLRPDGVLLANVSNAYLDVRAVVIAAAGANGFSGYARTDNDLAVAPQGDKEVSSWVAVSRDALALTFLAADQRWVPIESLGPGILWRDDFSDILSVIR